MSIKQRNDPWNEPVEVTENRADDRAEKRKAKIKYYLKPMLCSSIGLAIGFLSDNPFEFLLLLGLFGAYILLPD